MEHLGRYYSCKTVVVVAACLALGQRLTLSLAQAGATVVAIDSDACALHSLATQNPERIEPLALPLTG